MRKFQLYGLVGTVCINGLILLILLIITFSGAKEMIKPQEELLEVNFGDGDGGAGASDPGGSVSVPSTGARVVAASASRSTSSKDESVMTQQDESDVEVADKPAVKKDMNKPAPKTIEDKLQQLEQLRQREALRQQKAEETRQAQVAAANQAKINKANSSISNAFGHGSGGGVGNGNGSGSGSGGGRGTGGDGFGNGNGSGGTGSAPGNPLGHGSGGGNTWSLRGRQITGSLHKPSYVGNQEGKIVVAITVDKTGTVIATGIASGTTITDENQREECKAAARKQKFSPDSRATGNVVGTITYNFKFEGN
ncbi:MAG: energy transducer TonB [Paludibacteraceae bacterium]|nr:energy transducer TonB [Paludibacteraceae bacterium]